MKILFLSNSLGGLKSFRMEFIQTLAHRGHEILISSPCEDNIEMFIELGCKVFPINISRHGTNPFSELSLLIRYEKIISSISPDIILSYTIKPNIYGSIVGYILKIPIIASVTGLGEGVENNGIIQKIIIGMLKYAMKTTNHVYFQNQESMDFFKTKGINLRSQSLIAGSGVNLEKFYKAYYPDDSDGVRFLFIGRILESKGVRLYLEAAKDLKKDFPDSEFHIIGIKEDPILSALVEHYDKAGIVMFHGQQNDVRRFISNVHCQVHPTYYPEGMSNVLLESAAMGRPAITTDKSGCREIVENGITGFIIPQRSKEELIGKMRQFITLPWNIKKAMGEKARAKVEKVFDRNLIIHEYIKKIEELTDLKC